MKKISTMRLRAAPAALALLLALNFGQASAIDLVSAYRQALAYDPTSLAANDALSAGREKAVQGDALLRPRVNLTAGVNRIHDHSTGEVPPAASGLISGDSTGTARQATVQLVQPLYDMTAKANRQQLREQSTLAQIQFDESRQNLVLRVAEAYFGVVVAQETVGVVQAERDAIQQQRDRAQARFEVGQGKITDVHEAQARLDAMDTQEVSALSTLDLRRAQFLETIGSAPDQLSQLAPSFRPRLPEPAELRTWQLKGEDQNKLVRSKLVEY